MKDTREKSPIKNQLNLDENEIINYLLNNK